MAVKVFFLCSPNCPKQHRSSFPFFKFFYLTISGRISGVGKLLKKPQSVSLLSDPRHSTSQLFSLTRSEFFYYDKT